MTKDRKALIREYKETPRPMGVAIVRNMSNGKVFLFAGRDVPSLVNRNRAQLRLGGHYNRELQRDWNAQGADCFQFEIVDTLKPKDEPDYDPTDDLRELEALWMEKLDPFEPTGYNRRPKSQS